MGKQPLAWKKYCAEKSRQIGQIPPRFLICSSIFIKKKYRYQTEILVPSYCFIHICLKIKILESLLQLKRPSEVSRIGHCQNDLLFFMGFRDFRIDLVNVSVHFCTCISAWIDLNLSLRVVGIFKTYQSTPDKHINMIITFSTDDTPPQLPLKNSSACVYPIWHIFVTFNFRSLRNGL